MNQSRKNSSMKKFLILLISQILMITGVNSQSLHSILNQDYNSYKETALSQRRIKHEDLAPLIERVSTWDGFKVSTAGYSLEGRSISLISYGNGPVNVLLWSQMHGDEATATQALFDIFNFLRNEDSRLSGNMDQLREELTIHFVPMLNPDGAERFQRRNAQNIDINRDAVRLQTPEGRLLQQVHDSLGVSFGFNLHDQNRYYNVEGTGKQASISVLAPAFNEAKDINDVRAKAMQIIVRMNKVLQVYAPGHVGRYSDDFEPRAFGDNIQSWGTSTILIESGGYPGDREKQEIRRFNYLAILESLFSIASESYADENINDYELIPKNDGKFFDVKISNIRVEIGETSYITDIGINLNEIDNEDHSDYSLEAVIDDYGDLTTHYGYTQLDGEGLILEYGSIKEEYSGDYSDSDVLDMLMDGYGYVRDVREDIASDRLKINRVGVEFEVPEKLQPGSPATFFLRSADGIRYAVINGFIADLSKEDISEIQNAKDYYDK